MSINLQNGQLGFRRAQVATFIEYCNESLDKIAYTAYSDEAAHRYISQVFLKIRDEFFSHQYTFDLSSIELGGGRFQELREQVEEVLEVLRGGSAMVPLPLDYIDGSGEAYEEISQYHIRQIKEEICLGVARKVNQLVIDFHSDDRGKIILENDYHFLSGIQSVSNAKKILLNHNPRLFEHFPLEYKQNEAVIVTAIKCLPANIQHATQRLRGLEYIVFQVVLKNPSLFFYASDDLKEKKSFVIKLIKATKESCHTVLEHASEDLRNDFEVLSEAVQRSSKALSFASDRLKNNRTLLIIATKKHPEAIAAIGSDLAEKKEFILQIVRIEGACFQYLPFLWRDDFDVAMSALSRGSLFLQYVSQRLSQDPGIQKEVLIQQMRELRLASQQSSECLPCFRFFK